jgi:ABC-2 type transport system ATP-binding protein
VTADIPCIQATKIFKCFPGKGASAGKVVLSDVSFDVRYGEALALLGENGAGKSTLIECLVGTHAISAGTIEIARIRQDRSLRRSKRPLGVCFQEDLLDRDLPVASQILLTAQFHGASRRLAMSRSQEVLQDFGLAECGAEMPDSLSGGQRRRLQLAITFVSRPTRSAGC